MKFALKIDFFSQIGIAFLLFIVGLNLGFSKLKELGKIFLITGLGQVVFSTLIGYFIAIYLGFYNPMHLQVRFYHLRL